MCEHGSPTKKGCRLCRRMWGRNHYRLKHGIPLSAPRYLFSSAFERWTSYVEFTETCWIWKGGLDSEGYGKFSVKKKSVRAHHWGYEQIVGPIPKELVPDHLCRNHACVNPDCLEPVSNQINILRGVGLAAENAKKTHCPRGHLYDEINTWLTSSGSRACRECERQRYHRWYYANLEEQRERSRRRHARERGEIQNG